MKKLFLLCAGFLATMGASAQTLIEWNEEGTYSFYPEDLVAEGSISYDEDEACFVCDGSGAGKIMLNLDGKTIDFSEVAALTVKGQWENSDTTVTFAPGAWNDKDPLGTLVINDAVNGQINAWWGSRYAVDYKANNNDGVPYYTLSEKIDAFYFTARTIEENLGQDEEGNDIMEIVGSVPGYVYIDEIVLTKLQEQDPMAILGEMWHEWDACDVADANIVGDFQGSVALNTNLGGGAVFAGQMSGMVLGSIYADLSEYAGIYIKGTPGLLWRGLFNRVLMGDEGDYLNVVCELNEDGEYNLIFAENDLLKDAPFIHLNSVKLDWSSPEGRITKFNYIEKGGENGISDVITDANAQEGPAYNIYGQPVSDNYRGIVIKNGKKYFNK